ncbi:hypothetical protein AMTRI_Chr06g175600 [Amborella trichopoda]|uniref:seipin-1 isoform X2 n=1 Tax=Amborella trichopoda TaxID=13333 RepID=UPI0005D349F3|nr:seipin-1 isoform X2 [Amborella trichopoda]|eukprot:XP_006840194.2 seipin-1 isoform X2 [Amborella trichopoda]
MDSQTMTSPICLSPPPQESDPLLLKPVDWLIDLLSIHLNFISHFFSAISSTFYAFLSMVLEFFHSIGEAKHKAEETAHQELEAVSRAPLAVAEGGGLFAKKLVFGCLGATYVCSILVLLLVFSVLLGVGFVNLWVEEPVVVKKNLYFDYTQPHPVAVVSVDDLGNFKSLVRGKRAIPAGHTFFVSVVLVLPESDLNRNLGVFQLTAEILSVNGQMLARSSQPCMLRYRSAPIRLMHTFLMGLPLLVGLLGETQKLVIPVLEYNEESGPATRAIRVTLQPRTGTTNVPELYSAEIRVNSRLPLSKQVVHNWKWTCYVWASLYTYTLLLIITMCCCKRVVMGGPMRLTRGPTEELRPGGHQVSGDLSEPLPPSEKFSSGVIGEVFDESKRRSRGRSRRKEIFRRGLSPENVGELKSSLTVGESKGVEDSGSVCLGG